MPGGYFAQVENANRGDSVQCRRTCLAHHFADICLLPMQERRGRWGRAGAKRGGRGSAVTKDPGDIAFFRLLERKQPHVDGCVWSIIEVGTNLQCLPVAVHFH
jgi:hypothetical protein